MSFNSLNFRGVTLAFAAENLLNRTDDCVAIACDKDFSLNAGLGKAFSDKGGQQFTQNLVQLRAANQHIGNPAAFSIPGLGTLQCGNLILVPLRQFMRANFEDVFLEVFQCAINLGANSLALPLLGSGGFRMDRNEVSTALKSALETQFYFGSITRITIVDNKPLNIQYIKNVLENLIADDLINNPNFYPSTGSSNNQPNVAAFNPNATGPSNALPANPTPFAMFYTPLQLNELKELREKRLEEKMQIDTPNRDEEEALEGCPVCLLDLLEFDDNYKLDANETVVQLTKCPHKFHRECLISWFANKAQCPICNHTYNMPNGNQPNGTMRHTIVRGRLSGFPEREYIRIEYNFPDGIQTNEHPRPGTFYKGTHRVAYLPNNAEGHEVLHLLEFAFNRRLLFTVGDSITTGRQNVVTFNGVHHKTNRNGGPQNYGYPDAGYLNRVKQELAMFGITDQIFDADMDDSDEEEDDD
ncbi:E3 ubiquitin-protein ligase [Aphelenchoides bicaudatus]|nr:E3 ubiquitin-protein ligase [Aphelenchoides bicaudatus]